MPTIMGPLQAVQKASEAMTMKSLSVYVCRIIGKQIKDWNRNNCAECHFKMIPAHTSQRSSRICGSTWFRSGLMSESQSRPFGLAFG